MQCCGSRFIEIQIRIQHFKWIWIQIQSGSKALVIKRKEIQLENFLYIFLIKNLNLLIPTQGLHKGRPSYRDPLNPDQDPQHCINLADPIRSVKDSFVFGTFEIWIMLAVNKYSPCRRSGARMSPLLSSLSQMGGWATGPTAFKASSQEQKRKLPFFAEYTVWGRFLFHLPQGTPRHFLPNASGLRGVPFIRSFGQFCQHNVVFPKYPRYLRVFSS